MVASCDPLEELTIDFELKGKWLGGIRYEIKTEIDVLAKSLHFNENSKSCTVVTGLSFLNTIDVEDLVVRPNGENQLILTKRGNKEPLYRLYFTKGNKDSFEMKWENHTNLEKEYIPDKSFSVIMKPYT
jgi:hypothetical protein